MKEGIERTVFVLTALAATRRTRSGANRAAAGQSPSPRGGLRLRRGRSLAPQGIRPDRRGGHRRGLRRERRELDLGERGTKSRDLRTSSRTVSSARW